MQKNVILLCLLIFTVSISLAQTQAPVFYKGAVKEKKLALRRSIVQNTITKNLSYPLNNYTEDYWIDAFWAMELLHYQSPWANGRVNIAVDSMNHRTAAFQRALLELVYTNYPNQYAKQVGDLMHLTNNTKVFAMCAEYLLANKINPLKTFAFAGKTKQLVRDEKEDAIITQLLLRLENNPGSSINPPIKTMLQPGFLKNKTLVVSLQRKNRNYPGLVIIRDSTGNFVKDANGLIFSVPQLARSISNLPGYLTNGNTPQGIFRMFGFDTSKTTFIGPTTNIQLTMPFETSLQHFFGDTTITDSAWNLSWYEKLLPASLKNYRPLYESFYAGKAGRTEIIAHGTTIDPEYYSGETYYPQTPTMGCLCTKETWSEEDGKRLESDQQKLVTALQNAGGPDGYLLVIEIDDAPQPVNLQDILPLLQPATK